MQAPRPGATRLRPPAPVLVPQAGLRAARTPQVALFGLDEDADWHRPFCVRYTARGISYWRVARTPGVSSLQDETHHLEHDELLVFVVSGAALGFERLTALALAAAQVLASPRVRYLVAHVAPEIDARFEAQSLSQVRLARQMRALARLRLGALGHPRVVLAQSPDEALAVSLALYERLRLLG